MFSGGLLRRPTNQPPSPLNAGGKNKDNPVVQGSGEATFTPVWMEEKRLKSEEEEEEGGRHNSAEERQKCRQHEEKDDNKQRN